MANTVLITGADGYLGLQTSHSLLSNTGYDLLLWMRADSQDEADSKASTLRSTLREEYQSRVQLAFGNLASSNSFADVNNLEQITHVIHCAAVIKFNVEATKANEVNVAGSKQLFELCTKMPNLKQVNYISTVYASGSLEGTITENAFDAVPSFVNHYERSKNEAETLLLQEYSALPWNILRVATVIADNQSGNVSQYNAVHNTLRLLYNGLLSLLPGEIETPLYFVTGDFATESIQRVIKSDSTNQFYHISSNIDESVTLGQLLDQVYTIFSEDDRFGSKRILRPLMVEETEFAALAQNLEKLSVGIVGDAMASIAPFAGQLYINKRISNDTLQALWGDDYVSPVDHTLIDATVRYLIASKWGRENDL